MTAHQPPAPAEHPAAGAGPLTLGSLCTGYGGLDLAVAQVLNVAPAWVADPDPGAAAILAHHWPTVPNLGDITTVAWEDVPPVDIVTGGYPCQPFSVAGKRKGTSDARHIWPNIAHALRVLRPRYAFFENVANHLRLGFADVLADLAALGFDAEWTTVRASDVGAPHQRRRLFVLAVAQDADRATRDQWRDAASGQAEGGRAWADARGRGGAPAADPDDEREPGDGTARRAAQRHLESPGAAAADPEGVGHGDARPASVGGLAPTAVTSPAADPARDGRHEGRPKSARQLGGPDATVGGHSDAGLWGDYLPAIRRWERVTGRAAPNPREPAPRGGERLSPAFVEWLMGLDEGHVTGVPGLTRNAQLKALGNGVVWQQGAAALAHLIARIELEVT
ncbi:MAG UNVERIFIED_CONTAM: DNA cytosine methyltransferase [Thermobifida fusca]